MSLRNLILKIGYPLLELLPEKMMTKVKLVGNVLVNDWRMEPFCFFDINQTMPETETQKLFDQEDEETMKILHRQYLLGELFIAEKNHRRFFFNHSGLLYPQEADTIKEIYKAQKRFVRQTGLKDVGPETFYYKHGLNLLELSQREQQKARANIDAGAYRGESMLVLQDFLPSHIYAFEPSPTNCSAIQATIERNQMDRNIFSVIPMGLSDQVGILHIRDSGGATVNIHSKGDTMCEVTTIDLFVEKHPCDIGMIKADVEGEGLRLLRGGLKTICRNRPLLSIAVYHCAEEFVGIPKLLRELDLDYKIHLRCLNPMSISGEITLLAIP